MIVRLRTGLQAGKQKSLASAFALWKSETEHYRDYRATTLTYCFAKVRKALVSGNAHISFLARSFKCGANCLPDCH